MEKEVFRKISYDMIYLVRCAMYGVKPDKNRVEAMDLEALFDVCQTHILTACTAYALESVGVRNKARSPRQRKRQSGRISCWTLSVPGYFPHWSRRGYGICP